jgi:hypothetical protein
VDAGVGGHFDQVRVFLFAVVVEWPQVVDDGWIAEQLCEDVASDQLVGDFLEQIFLVLVDLVGFVADGRGALVGIDQRPGGCRVEYFLVELLEIADVKIWNLLHDSQNHRRMHWPHDFVHLNSKCDQRCLQRPKVRNRNWQLTTKDFHLHD